MIHYDWLQGCEILQPNLGQFYNQYMARNKKAYITIVVEENLPLKDS